MPEIYYIYKITNKLNGKFYIGKHKQLENEPFDRYWGSGKILNQAFNKYGKENFTKEIIEECTKENINEREIYWIEKLNARCGNYNVSRGGKGGNSTVGTKVYTNGINRKYLKSGEKIPEGYYLGVQEYSDNQRNNMSKSMIGKNKNHIPWNKGLDNNNDIVKLNALHAKETIQRTGILKGANNPRAKTFIFISPTGEKYKVIGQLRVFCEEHNISLNLVKKFINKGEITLCKNNASKKPITLGSVGWQVIKLDKNSVQEARESRKNTYRVLYEKNLLSKKQRNISKKNKNFN